MFDFELELSQRIGGGGVDGFPAFKQRDGCSQITAPNESVTVPEMAGSAAHVEQRGPADVEIAIIKKIVRTRCITPPGSALFYRTGSCSGPTVIFPLRGDRRQFVVRPLQLRGSGGFSPRFPFTL